MSNDQLEQLVNILRANFQGSQSDRRDALEQLDKAKFDPQFSGMLCQIFNAGHLDAQTRQLAGITLKNNLEAARKQLGERVFYEAGNVALESIKGNNNSNPALARTAANIMSRITSIVGLDWWKAQFNIDLGDFVISGLLNQENAQQSSLGILCLQYLVEDASHQLGSHVEHIINALSEFAMNRHQNAHLSDRALATLCNIYDFGKSLDWMVQVWTPVQQGLCNAARNALRCGVGYFDQANLLNLDGRCETRRLCLKILFYTIDFFQLPEDANYDACKDISRVACLVFTSGIMKHEREVAIEAAEVLTRLLVTAEAVHETGGGPEAGVTMMSDGINQLLDSVYSGIHLRNDDLTARLENDNPNQRGTYRTAGLGTRFQSKDAAEEAADDGGEGGDGSSVDEASNPLQNSCRKLLSCMSVALSAPVFDSASRFAGDRFQGFNLSGGNGNTSIPEMIAALDVLACVHDGCKNHLSNFVVDLGNQLIQICDNRDNIHPVVTATALFCLGKFFLDFAQHDQKEITNKTFSVALECMEFPRSKCVQLAAVTAVKFIVCSCIAFKMQDILQHHLQNICGVVGNCFKNYHTNNFQLLCEFVPFLVDLLDDEGLNFFIDLCVDVCRDKYNSLRGSFEARFLSNNNNNNNNNNNQGSSSSSSGNSNVVVEKEFFDVLKACATSWYHTQINGDRWNPQRWGPLCEELLKKLIDFIDVLLTNFTPIQEDADLLDYPLALLRLFSGETGILIQHKNVLCPVYQNLPSMLVTAFKRCTSDLHIRSWILGNCYDILLLEPSLFSDDNMNKLHLAISDVFAGDNPNQDTSMFQALQADAALALYAMSQVPNIPFDISGTMTGVAEVVNGEMSEGNSHMGNIAQCAGIFMYQKPQIFSPSEAEQVICALKFAGKDYYGAQAYAGVCEYMAGLAQHDRDKVRPVLQDLASLIVAWQYDLENFQQVIPSVQKVLGACDPILAQLVNSDAVLSAYR